MGELFSVECATLLSNKYFISYTAFEKPNNLRCDNDLLS